MTDKPKATLVPELACRDAAASMAFYTKILGFRVLYDRPEYGFYYLERHGAEIMIEQLSDTSWLTGVLELPFGRGLHFQIMTTDLAALYDTCIAHRVTIFRECEDAWYRADDHYVGQRQFIVCDLDGYMLRFAENLGAQSELPQTGRVVG